MFSRLQQLLAGDGFIRDEHRGVVVPSNFQRLLQLNPFGRQGVELVQLVGEAVVAAALPPDEDHGARSVLFIKDA